MENRSALVITGMGASCSLGTNCHEIERALFSPRGERILQNASTLDARALAYPFFAAKTFCRSTGKEREKNSADTLLLAREAATEAIGQAEIQDRSMAVLVGSTSGCALHFLNGYEAVRKGEERRKDCALFLSANPSLTLAKDFHLAGLQLTLSNACTSGADAIGLATDILQTGRAESVLCGGADALSLVPHTGFARLTIYDKEPCRPFDITRKGLNLGEGAAFFVLERESHARQRGARILGRVLGYGLGTDAYHFTAPHPEGRGLMSALSQSLQQAGLKPEDLAFANVHGTGTMENDLVEGKTLHKVLPDLPFWGTKGSTGHTLGAAGALEAVFTVLALRRREVPASLGFHECDPKIGVGLTTERLAITKSAAISSSLGFGGGNAVLVLSRGED